MFGNKVKQVAKQAFETGRAAIKRAPQALGQVLDYSNKAAATARKIGETANRVKEVYDKSAPIIGTTKSQNDAVKKGFDYVGRGIKRIDNANQALQNVGANVATLF